MSEPTVFYLNRERVETDASRGLLLLDYIRKQRRLVGTKEGCKEGDCGACMVLLGTHVEGRIQYLPMTSCLIPLGEIHGKHVVTVEGLNVEGLTPVQSAIVDLGATQCGYCTPGFVVSVTGMLLDPAKNLDEETMKVALGSNLCRCTGYRSLKEGLVLLRKNLGHTLPVERVDHLVAKDALPLYFLDIPEWLAEIPAAKKIENPDRYIAGGTDLYVQQGLRLPDREVALLSQRADLQGISREAGVIRVGALTTFEAFGSDPHMLEMIPALPEYLLLMASWAIRNRATLSGNLVNASPIGDMTSLLLALDPEIVLEAPGGATRTTLLRDFYLDYKVMDRSPDEILTQILIPVRSEDALFSWGKVSKRKSLDIATVNSGMRIRVVDNDIVDVAISLGGVAATPLYLTQTNKWLMGKPLTAETIIEACNRMQEEFDPISDVRGSALYKRLLARQLVLAHFMRLFPGTFHMEDFDEAS